MCIHAHPTRRGNMQRRSRLLSAATCSLPDLDEAIRLLFQRCDKKNGTVPHEEPAQAQGHAGQRERIVALNKLDIALYKRAHSITTLPLSLASLDLVVKCRRCPLHRGLLAGLAAERSGSDERKLAKVEQIIA